MGSHSLFQRILLTQGSNLSLLHCRQILYHLSQQGSPHNRQGKWLWKALPPQVRGGQPRKHYFPSLLQSLSKQINKNGNRVTRNAFILLKNDPKFTDINILATDDLMEGRRERGREVTVRQKADGPQVEQLESVHCGWILQDKDNSRSREELSTAQIKDHTFLILEAEDNQPQVHREAPRGSKRGGAPPHSRWCQPTHGPLH